MDDSQTEVLRHIGLTLAYKNCLNDLKEFEKVKLKSGFVLPWMVEAVMEVLKVDLKLYRGIHIDVEVDSETTRIYHWRKGKSRGSIRLTTDQLLKLTSDTCIKYFNDNRVKIEKKKGWY
ncbi:hypothetical protein SAMN04489762_3396 [Terribacillus saccharophilus]|uniref:Uncharacterized protein n=1 Tax=Terribacillus saccharophilus TaxID=361277 RepID=A0AAX2EJN5_9BACI|nr:hypothetical protein SAMN04489762_3396 [Terribacillus saccharophilus]